MKIYKIEKRGNKWVVLTEDGGKVLGTHDDEESAKKQLAAIEAGKAKRKAMEAVVNHIRYDPYNSVEQGFFEALEYEELTTITDVDIFAVGTWRGANSPKEGDKYEENDLRDIVEAFEAGVVDPHIKITHGDDNQQIDVGKVANLKVKAGKLFADFVNVPKALYELMKKGLFKARSAEVLWNVEKGGKKWPRVLKAVALLAPGQRPAVTGISEGYTFGAQYCYEWPQEKDYGISSIISAWGKWAGSFDSCVSRLSGKPGIGNAKRLCAWIHKRAEGKWPAQHEGATDYEPTEGEIVALQYITKKIIRQQEVEQMTIEQLMKKYGAKDEKHLEEILDGNLAELDKEKKKSEAANKKAEEYEAKEAEQRKKDIERFIETATKDGLVLPKEHELVRGIFEDVQALDGEREYEVADGKKQTGKVLERLYHFISGLDKRVDPGEKSRKGKDSDADPEKKPAGEVFRLQTEYMDSGEAKTIEEANALIQKNEPELYERWLKGE